MYNENASPTIIDVDSRSLPHGFKKLSQKIIFCRIQSNKSYGHIHRSHHCLMTILNR